MAFLTDDDAAGGLVLTLMKAKQVEYPGNFHIGFFVASEETVDEVHRQLRSDGYEVADPAQTGHSYGFYVGAPGGFRVEIGA
jgi:lactoylglutathione lyase